MHTEYRVQGDQALFVVHDLPERYHAAAQKVGHEPFEGGLARRYPSDSLYLERAYANYGRLLEDYLATEAGERPVRWESALEAFLAATAGRDLLWLLVGSASLAVRGLDVSPGDIDLATDAAGARLLGELLAEALVEPVMPVSDWICRWWGRAWMGARVEWVGDVLPTVDQPYPADFGPTAVAQAVTVPWRGYQVPVPPLELMLAVTERRGLAQRAEAIRQAMAQGQR
jgi:hypothetical protein